MAKMTVWLALLLSRLGHQVKTPGIRPVRLAIACAVMGVLALLASLAKQLIIKVAAW